MENQIVPSIFEELEQQSLHVVYATTGQRFLNYLIDAIVLYGLLFLIAFVAGAFAGSSDINASFADSLANNKIFQYIFTLVLQIVYYLTFEGLSHGRTLGKLVTKTVAMKADFTPLTAGDAAIRTLCRLIPFEPLSGFGGFPWHDKLSKTIVVQKGTR